MNYLRKAPLSLISLAAVLPLGLLSARAEVVAFAAGPIYGGAKMFTAGSTYRGTVTCRIYNNGTAARIVNRRIYANTNVAVVLDGGNSCTATLAARAYCAYSHQITGNLAFTCMINVNATKASITGVAELRDQLGEIVTTVPFSR